MKALNIIVLLAGLFAAVNSYAAGTVLMEKHGAAWPQSQNGYATKYQCMKCHGDYKNLAQKTKDSSPNPHYSHMGEVNYKRKRNLPFSRSRLTESRNGSKIKH